MKRETMKWLRCRADGSTWWPPDVEAQDVLAELERLRRIERAAKALDTKLAKVHLDPEYKGVWMWAERHGLKYTGLQYDSELDELRAALKKGGGK